MQHAARPLTLWDEVFPSMIYLINRLPSSLSKVVPCVTLFNKQPDYTLLRVLGCMCFSYTRPYNDHKLQPRSMPYVFLGYCSSQKGYKYFHIPTNKIYVSRHIIFDEGTFHFRSQASSGSTSSSSADPAIPIASLFPSDHVSSPLVTVVASNSNSHVVATSTSTRTPLISQQLPSASSSTDSFSPYYNSSSSLISHHITPPTPVVSTSLPYHTHPMVTRTQNNTRKIRLFPDHIAYMCAGPETEPKTFHQDNSSPQWCQAMT
jgi:hypothetical protein